MKSAVLRRFAEASGFTVMRFAVVIDIAALLGIIGLIIVNAWPALSWEFLTEPPRDLMTKGGILPCILGTFCLAVGALVIALPLGVASAVYLHEYSRPSAWVTMTRLSIANLAGVPSIVFGLFGLTFFVVFCGFGVSLLSGILTLAVLSLPIIINTTEAALSQVPQDWREASLALGASRRETTLKVVLPNALPGILTGAILGLARAPAKPPRSCTRGASSLRRRTGSPPSSPSWHCHTTSTCSRLRAPTLRRRVRFSTALRLSFSFLCFS